MCHLVLHNALDYWTTPQLTDILDAVSSRKRVVDLHIHDALSVEKRQRAWEVDEILVFETDEYETGEFEQATRDFVEAVQSAGNGNVSFYTAHWYSPLNAIVGYVRLTEFGEVDKREDGDFK
jgi:hypothetical protein